MGKMIVCKKCGRVIIGGSTTEVCLKCEKRDKISNKEIDLSKYNVTPSGQIEYKKEEEKDQKLGMKFDDEKLDFTLVPAIGLKEEVKVLMVGAEKYKKNNWKKVPDGFHRYIKAILRHANEIVEAMNNDKDPMLLKDPDTGLHPCAAIACDAHFALDFINEENKLDDKTWKIKKEEIREKYKKQRENFLKDDQND